MAPLLKQLKTHASHGPFKNNALHGSGSLKKKNTDIDSGVSKRKLKRASASPANSRNGLTISPKLSARTASETNLNDLAKMYETPKQNHQGQEDETQVLSSKKRSSRRLNRRKRIKLRKKLLQGTETGVALQSNPKKSTGRLVPNVLELDADSGITDSSADENDERLKSSKKRKANNSNEEEIFSHDYVKESGFGAAAADDDDDDDDYNDRNSDSLKEDSLGVDEDDEIEEEEDSDHGDEEEKGEDSGNEDDNERESSDKEESGVHGSVKEAQICVSDKVRNAEEKTNSNRIHRKVDPPAKEVEENSSKGNTGVKEGTTITSKKRHKVEMTAAKIDLKKSRLEANEQSKNTQNSVQKNKRKHIDREKQKSPQEAKLIVFITNLPFSASEDDIREHFKDVQSIKSINIMKNENTEKSLGRATMELDDYLSYAKALAMHRVHMNNRPLYIVPDKSMPKGISKGLIPNKTKDDEQNIYRVCVSQLPSSLSLKKIKKHFSALGRVKRFIVPVVNEKSQDGNNQRTMILEFDDMDLYKKTLNLNGSLVLEHPITVEPLSQCDRTEEVKKRKADELETECSPIKKSKVEESALDNDEANGKHKFAIFIGSIPLSATREALKAHFEEAGKVLECRIRTLGSNSSTKTAYVRMSDEMGYEKALALKTSKFEGRQLIIEAFKKQSEKKKKRFVVFVGNIPFTSKDEDVRRHFKNIGNILDVRFPLNKENKPQGYAYVEFADQPSFEKSLTLHHSFMNGRRINVCYSTSQRTSRDKKPTSVVKQKLFKLQTLSQKQQLQQQSPVKRRSKPDKKKREANRLKKIQHNLEK